MTPIVPFSPPGFDDLSVEEKLDYVQSLWNRIDSDPEEDEPVPDWHLEIVRERLAEHRAHPEDVIPWEGLRDELLKSIREAAVPLSMPAARSLAEDWQRRLAGKIKGDSSELIREDRER